MKLSPQSAKLQCRPVSVAMALRQGLALVEPVVKVEEVPLEQAHGRVLATAVQARVPLPLFVNSATDGWHCWRKPMVYF